MPKAPRNLLACQECRSRKVRCDGTKPRCDTCMRRSQACNWTARLAPGNYQFVYVEEAASAQTPPRHIQTNSPGNVTSPRQQPIDDALSTALRQRLLHIFTQTHQMLELCGCVDIDTLKQTVGTDKDQFLLHSIMALSSLHLTDVEIASQSRFANSKSFMSFYRSKAQASSRSLSDEPSVVTIQGNLVLGLFELLTMATSKAWLHIGLAIRMAQTLRMRREYNRRLVPRHREVRRRTFWACVILDRLVAYCTFRTQTIELQLVDLHLPCSEVAFAFGHETPGPTMQELGTAAGDIGAEKMSLAYFVKTVLLWSPVARIYVDGGRKVERSDRRRPALSSLEYEARVSAWRDTLPAEMQWSERNLRAHQSLGQASHFISMHLLIQHASFLSHHEHLPHADEPGLLQTSQSNNDTTTITLCLEGANRVVTMLRLIDSITAGLCHTQLGVCAGIPMVTAASVLLWAHHCSPSAKLSVTLSNDQLAQAKDDVDYLVFVLDSWAKTWGLARAWANCIRLLDEFYLSRYRHGNQPLKIDNSASTTVPTETESPPVSPTPLRDGDGFPDLTMIPKDTYYKVRLITGLILEQPELCKKFLQGSTEPSFGEREPEGQIDLWGIDMEEFAWMNDPDLAVAASTLWNDFAF